MSEKYCRFCDSSYTEIYHGIFCSMECTKKHYQKIKIIDSIQSQLSSTSSLKTLLDLEDKLEQIEKRNN